MTGRTEIVCTVEEAGQRLTVRRRGVRYDVMLGTVVLLSSAALETERAFGRLAPAKARRVIVGGLGFGATVRGVLEAVGSAAKVVVVEKLAAVERLVRGELSSLTRGALDDPRVEVVHADVLDFLGEAGDPADAILLDVDNGPHWASFRSNARLYADPGLALARRSLSPHGLLAVWSGYPADAFLGRLRRAGFTASRVPLEERGVVRARAYLGIKR